MGHRYSTARVSKRPIDEPAAQQSRAVLYRQVADYFRLASLVLSVAAPFELWTGSV